MADIVAICLLISTLIQSNVPYFRKAYAQVAHSFAANMASKAKTCFLLLPLYFRYTVSYYNNNVL
jgi:hypothetical protein